MGIDVKPNAANAPESDRVVSSVADDKTERRWIGPHVHDDATESDRVVSSVADDATECDRIGSLVVDDDTERHRVGLPAAGAATECHRVGPSGLERHSVDPPASDDNLRICSLPPKDTTEYNRVFPQASGDFTERHLVGPPAPDGGWGWIIVICAMVLNFLIGGAVNTFGVIYVELLDLFQESSGKTAWVGSMANAMGLLLGPVSSALSARFSCRTMVIVGGVLTAAGWALTGLMPRLEYMFLTYGLLAGIGKSLAYTPSIVILGKWFRRRHSLATGLAVAGAGMGTFAFAPLLEMLFKTVEFKYTMFIMAGVMVNISICGVFFRDVPSDKCAFTSDTDKERANDIYFIETITNEQSRKENEFCGKDDMARESKIYARYQRTSGNSEHEQKGLREYLDYTLLKKPLFLCFGVSVMLATCGHSPASVMLPPLAIEHHVTPQRAAFLLSITGIADIVGRLTFGFLCDIGMLRNYRKYLYMLSIFISGIANITCGFSTQYWQFTTYSVIFGLFAGSYNALTPVILVDLLGSDKLASSFGLALLFQGTGFLLGPPMAGWIRDGVGNYQSAFYFAGFSMIASSLVMGLPAICSRNRNKHNQKKTGKHFTKLVGNVKLVGVTNFGFTEGVDEYFQDRSKG